MEGEAGGGRCSRGGRGRGGLPGLGVLFLGLLGESGLAVIFLLCGIYDCVAWDFSFFELLTGF